MNEIRIGDCRDVMPTLAADSFDAIVTDPPYHLTQLSRGGHARTNNPETPHGRTRIGDKGFMGKNWDGGDVAFRSETWKAVLRVAKPGAHLLAFGGTRTFHRLMVAIEDAGWELRDTIMWVYGSGFPKSHNLEGNWQGWGTALKPAWEPIIVARKPFRANVADNMALHRTGAINIDASRIATAGEQILQHGKGGIPARHDVDTARDPHPVAERDSNLGRWPANIIHDGSDEVVALFPAEAGAFAPVHKRNGDKFRTTFGAFKGDVDEAGSTFQGDGGSAARFFYCAKADRQDRDEGCERFEKKPLNWSSGDENPGSFQAEGTDRTARNNHPTVKPTALMRYLCKLVTAPGGVILDPFMGSGSTGKAAMLEQFSFVGIEQEPDYAAIAAARIAHVDPAAMVLT